MKINKKFLFPPVSFFFIILFIAGGVIYPQNKNNKNNKNTDKNAAGNSSGVEVINGMTEIILTPKEQLHSGIETTRLLKTYNRVQITAYGSVVSIQDLSNDAQDYETAKAQLAKSEENLVISQKNYDRIKRLFGKKLTSEQDYQTSQAAYLSDNADVASGKSNLTGIKSRITEQWGIEISKSIFEDSSLLQSILSLNETLIQISLPPGEINIKKPATIFILSPESSSKEIICRFISEGRLANSQFQTRTLYYTTAGNSLSGGMNVKAFLPVGEKLSGVVIPRSSVVWYNGKAWVYIEVNKDRFIRTAVKTDNQTETGFFVPENKSELNPDVEVVTKGVQLLLSKEMLPAQKTSAGEEDND